MEIHDENGSSLETASNLKARFEALKLLEQKEEEEKGKQKFRPKRFKVGTVKRLSAFKRGN